ncbi:MAG TPA: protein-L-isoaspartate(D-aspartate) O-methyltransferase [Treponemataceae bacterium]|nr:protein-L-isoaspartate(D-aspartate) O-methyltransferase [Treponemataceae bacterium]HPS44773.1 protein-L-isoaspartate(D-aspartate) O-methyltransferase [Treponemataceae bacterium]
MEMTTAERDAIERMIDSQIKARGIADSRVLAALARVNRFRFVPEEYRELACSDQALPLIEGQTISQPYIVAKMTELLELSSASRVLEVGTGYQTAVLAELAGEVWSLEILKDLHDLARRNLAADGYPNAHLIEGNGYEGYPDAAPFDAIIVTAAPPAIPGKLVAQLATNGRMVIPVGTALQMLSVITRISGDRVREEHIFPVAFVPMVNAPFGSPRP